MENPLNSPEKFASRIVWTSKGASSDMLFNEVRNTDIESLSKGFGKSDRRKVFDIMNREGVPYQRTLETIQQLKAARPGDFNG